MKKYPEISIQHKGGGLKINKVHIIYNTTLDNLEKNKRFSIQYEREILLCWISPRLP